MNFEIREILPPMLSLSLEAALEAPVPRESP